MIFNYPFISLSSCLKAFACKVIHIIWGAVMKTTEKEAEHLADTQEKVRDGFVDMLIKFILIFSHWLNTRVYLYSSKWHLRSLIVGFKVFASHWKSYWRHFMSCIRTIGATFIDIAKACLFYRQDFYSFFCCIE